MSYWYLAVLCLIFTTLLVRSESKNQMVAALVFKTLSSLSFVALGILSFGLAKDRSLAVFLLIGLILGAVGDVLLNVCHLVNESVVVFFIGGFSFFIGHILYLFVLVPTAEGFALPAVLCGIAVAALLLVFLHRKQKADRLLFVESLGYMVTVSTMASFAVFGLFAKGFGTATVFRAIGGILFLTSDTMLFFRMIRKGESHPVLAAFLLFTYYPAQCLIAASMQHM